MNAGFGKGKTFTLQEYIGQYFQGRLEVGWTDTKMITCYCKQVTRASTIACQFMIMYDIILHTFRPCIIQVVHSLLPSQSCFELTYQSTSCSGVSAINYHKINARISTKESKAQTSYDNAQF